MADRPSSIAKVTVAVPVLNGGPLFAELLRAVSSQSLNREIELLVADSGSVDGSRPSAEAAGARVIDIPPGRFSHGGTRNLLASEASGSHVAFLTQDSIPAHERWLERLLEGFELADDVALVFGPYRARPRASPMTRRELDEFFSSFSPDGRPRVDRADSPDDGSGLGRRTWFTDANGCLTRAAWQRVPFREVSYAEDHVLARDMLSAGYAKAYHPDAAVIHSHEYTPLTLFKRCFDEWRALREVHGHVAPASPIRTGLMVQREVRDDLQLMRREGVSGAALVADGAASFRHHAIRTAGAALGSRAEGLPPWIRRRLSLEGRPAFSPVPPVSSGDPK
jgi:glycosyltransferase involved in cell wall biosynthesis